MRAWFFTEGPYPFLPDETEYESVRITIPNKYYDPVRGADLWHQYIELYQMADELGLDMMLNEHHATPTCVDPAISVMTGALAHATSKGRILQLGNPGANRRDPLRLAEETALADVLSRGRLEVGFIRGVPYEITPANANPVGTTERLWEFHDLVKAAWTSHDGPFHYEGENFHYRNVNIWPRPYQDPHPPIWFVGMSAPTNVPLADNAYVTASFLMGHQTRPLFDVYRNRWSELGRGEAPMDRFALMAFVYVGDTDEEAREVAEKFAWYVTDAHKIPPQYYPIGYNTMASTMRAMRRGGGQSPLSAWDVDALIESGTLICGSPDTVYEQIKRLYKSVGFGHLLAHAHAGFMTYEETAKNIRLLGTEVMPRLAKIEIEEELDDAPPPPAVVGV